MNPSNKKPLGERSHYKWAASEPELHKYVARLIKETRLSRDMDVEDAAVAAGISRSAFYRWERGDVGEHTAKVVAWLLRDNSDSCDPLYWRERALLAESALRHVGDSLVRYRYRREDFIGDDLGAGKLKSGNHNGSQAPGS